MRMQAHRRRHDHNPMTHQGQIDGAIMQGGYAPMEQLASEEGHISTLSMGEVKTPTMQDMPELVTVLVESPGGNGPYGAKTIGSSRFPGGPGHRQRRLRCGGSPYPRLAHHGGKSARRVTAKGDPLRLATGQRVSTKVKAEDERERVPPSLPDPGAADLMSDHLEQEVHERVPGASAYACLFPGPASTRPGHQHRPGPVSPARS